MSLVRRNIEYPHSSHRRKKFVRYSPSFLQVVTFTAAMTAAAWDSALALLTAAEESRGAQLDATAVNVATAASAHNYVLFKYAGAGNSFDLAVHFWLLTLPSPP